MSRSGRSFFGLRSDDDSTANFKKNLLEEVFTLVWHGKLSLSEVWNMPVEVRKWWWDRMEQELSKKKGGDSPQR